MPLRNLLIRADATAELGVGHVMRCIALAEAWEDAGGRALFALADGVRDLGNRICFHGGEVTTIPCMPGSREDAAETLQLAKRCDAEWLVLDGYHFSPDYLRTLDGGKSHLLVIADGEHVPDLGCDIVVNPDPISLGETHQPATGRAKFLLGPQYALVRKEFLKQPVANERAPETARRILVTLGGGDANNVTLQVLHALHYIHDVKLELTVIVGPSNPHIASLQVAIKESRHSVNLLSNPTNMPDLMAQAEMAVTAGGGTCYELAFMKVPMFFVITAQNQERLVQALHDAGAGVDAGWFSSIASKELAASLRDLIYNQALRRELVESARGLVDGKGAGRIVAKMNSMFRGNLLI
jgi:UDP-2,4-diacetamido-2,4,6-trideoxy-beta-L-altropyranose hydrolase